MTLLRPCMAQGGASGKVSTTITTSTSEEKKSTALSRKRQEILAKSMEVFDRELDTWLDISFAEPMKRVRKRARAAVESDDHDSGVEDGSTTTTTTTNPGLKSNSQAVTAAGAVVGRNTKKRAKRESSSSTVKTPALASTHATASPTSGGGDATTTTSTSLFACPFYAHNPAKYKTVKTCLGPGWNNTHRVKEHIYRRHCLKHTCPRCCEPFKSDEELRHHQRLDEPCKKSNRGVADGSSSNNNNVITGEQEKLIRLRAKTNQPEEERWRELYRILFPGEKGVPSPYYGSTTPTIKSEDETKPTVISASPSPAPVSYRCPSSSPSPARSNRESTRGSRHPATTSSGSGGPSPLESIQFRDEAELFECRQTIHRNLNRAVRPVLEHEVDKMLRSVQHAMTVKVTELCKDIVTKIFRTWQFGNEQQQQAHAHAHAQRVVHASLRPNETRGYQQAQVQTQVQNDTYAAQPSTGDYWHTQSVNHKVEEEENEEEKNEEEENEEEECPGPIEVDYEQFLLRESSPSMLNIFTESGEFDIESFIRENEGEHGTVGLDLGCGGGAGETFSLSGTGTTSDSAYFSTISESVDGSMSGSISLDRSSSTSRSGGGIYY